MSETGSALGPESFGVEIDDFEAVLDQGGVGGDVTVEPDEVIGVIDGKEVRNVVVTSSRVEDVLGMGLEEPPFGEEV